MNQEIILRKGLYCLVAKLDGDWVEEVEDRSKLITGKRSVVTTYRRFHNDSYRIIMIPYPQGYNKPAGKGVIATIPDEELPEKVRKLFEADAKSLQKLLEGGFSIELHRS